MATFWKASTDNFVQTTLNGAINDSTTTITVNDASKLQAPGYIVIDRQDGNGNNTPSSREVITFTGISGSDLTGCTRAADNSTARSHSDGALVESAPTVGLWNDLRNAVATAMLTDGTGINVSTATVTDQLTAVKALMSTVTISGLLNVSGASVVGFSAAGSNFLFQVPGSLASQADIGGRIPVPAVSTGKFIQAYVKTPASVASIGVFILKNQAVYGVCHIAGGETYASSASIASAGLVAGDVLTMDIRSTASLSQDLSVMLRAL